MDETRALAEFIATTELDDIPTPLLDRLRWYVLDALAAGLVGWELPWSRIVREQARQHGGVAEASAFCMADRLPASTAAWVNGVAVGGFELDHGAHLAHPASTVFPAALAVAEAHRVSGSRFLLALALGYETACRVGAAQTRAVEDNRGFHNPGANGPFGAAAAAGRLLELDPGGQASALGIAGSSAGGTVAYLDHGSMTKRLHLGAAARGGLEAAQLAAAGFTGPPTILEGRWGFLHAFSPDPRPDALTSGLGSKWLAATLRIKPYACHGALQGLVTALQRLRAEEPAVVARVERVGITAGESDRILQRRFLHPEPRSLIEAQCSTPFAAAVALRRDLADPRSFGPEVLGDPEVCRLAANVTWQEVPDRRGVHVVVQSPGQTRQIDVATVQSAVPATWDAVVDKFRRHTAHSFTASEQERVVDLVSRLGDLPDLHGLAGWVRGKRLTGESQSPMVR